ncbi:hypothetical protein ASPGLDRAFT_53868 [Aspergillus terreus]|uniref:NADH dehydrogenase [ubiquinone] 1 alpha subcomplex subunit 1 n=1 Tax=Aspergillus terreus TaxID=33178 RepID=A0A5M3Z346_ASPTE|nr:hypothetical protein ATETN484_0006042300 [Aspergillus terreus]GFF11987.1 hypothetical protein ASPGLDRAFT_53868 [Aspergillus terreus]
MGVPFEALLPYGIMITMFGVTGAGLTAVKYFSNDGKKARWNRDLWDRVSFLTTYSVKLGDLADPLTAKYVTDLTIRPNTLFDVAIASR